MLGINQIPWRNSRNILVFAVLNEAGAGGGNRTRVISLEGWSNTIIRHPQRGHFSLLACVVNQPAGRVGLDEFTVTAGRARD